MDSDLPLFEISGEDDSLIQQTPTLLNDAVKATDTILSVSPLHLPISPTGPIAKSVKYKVASKRLSCLSPKSSNKENMNSNRLDGPKLSPLQMKKRKKGYNLRKSLAWDQAFFTEEGVLDPDELSMISGTYGNTSGGALSLISEERMKSPCSGSKYSYASQNLQSSSANKHRNCGNLLPPQHNSLASDKLGPKSMEVQSNNGRSCSRSGVKSGRCPRPLLPSSLKRPAHMHSTKSAKKDMDLPKVPGHTLAPPSLPKTSKRSMLGTSHSKQSQTARPTVNTQTNISFEDSYKNVKSNQKQERSAPKCTPLPAKASVQSSTDIMGNSSVEVNSLMNPQPLEIRRSSEANVKPVITSNPAYSAKGLYRATGGNESQLHKLKPSGLKMPSPSLGYFDQNSAQPTNIPNSTGIGSQKFVRDFRAPHAPRSTSAINSDISENSSNVGLSSSVKCSGLTASKAVMHKTMETDKVNDVKNGGIPVLPNKRSEPKRSKHDVHSDIDTGTNIVRHGTHRGSKEVAYQVATDVQITNDQKLLESKTCKKSGEDNQGRRVYTPSLNQNKSMEVCHYKPENISEMQTISVQGSESTSKHQHREKDLQNQSPTNHGFSSELQYKLLNKDQEGNCLTVHSDRDKNGFQEHDDSFTEQTYECNSELYSKDLQDKEAIVSNQCVIQDGNKLIKCELNGPEVISSLSPFQSQDGEFDNRITEQPHVQTQCGFANVSPQAEIQECSISSKAGKPFLGEVSGSWLQCDRASSYEGYEIEAHNFRNNAIVEGVAADSGLACSCKGETVEVSQNEYSSKIVEESSILRASSRIDAEWFKHLSQFQGLERTHEGTSGVDILTNKSHVKISQQYHMNMTAKTEHWREESNMSSPSTVSTTCLGDSAKAYMKDKDATTSIRKQSETKPDSTINPPADAVQFSDELLVHVKAAAEELNHPCIEQPEPVEALTGDANRFPCVDNHMIGCNISLYNKGNVRVNGVDATSFSFSGHEQNRDNFLFKGKLSEQENETNTILHKLSASSDAIDEQLLNHGDILNVERKLVTSLDNFDLQNSCLGVKQSYQCNPKLCYKEFRAKDENPSNQVAFMERNEISTSVTTGSEIISALSAARSDDGGVDIDRLTEQFPWDSQFVSAEGSPKAEIQEYFVDKHLRHEDEPIDNATSLNVDKILGEVSGSRVQCDQSLLNDGDKKDACRYMNNAVREGVSANSCLGGTGKGEAVEVPQNECTGRNIEDSCILQASSGSEAGYFQHLSEFQNIERPSEEKSNMSHQQPMKITASPEQLREEPNPCSSFTVSDKCFGDSVKAYLMDKDASTSIRKQFERGTKPSSIIIPPPDAVPFSDEWLAAVEAAGEDILTKKSGAVQNSPPDKSLPEPSPWSPVKRKASEIGPFDCTKYTNTQPADL